MERRVTGKLVFPVSRRVQINFIFPDNVLPVYVYCVKLYTAVLCRQKIVEFTHKRQFKRWIFWLNFVSTVSTARSAFDQVSIAASLFIKRRIPGDFTGSKCTDCSIL